MIPAVGRPGACAGVSTRVVACAGAGARLGRVVLPRGSFGGASSRHGGESSLLWDFARPARPLRRDCGSVVATAVADDAEEAAETLTPAITVTPRALRRLDELKRQKAADDGLDEGAELLLRIGVKQGGCSGMSYTMDFESGGQVDEDDAVMNLDGGFRLVCDPKSLLFLFGLELDFSSELIGGGFKFNNPNADATCGCGKSFSA